MENDSDKTMRMPPSPTNSAFRKLSVAPTKSPEPLTSSSHNNIVQLERETSQSSGCAIAHSLSIFSSVDEDEALHRDIQTKSVFRNNMLHVEFGNEFNDDSRCRSTGDMRTIRRASPVGCSVPYEPTHPQYAVDGHLTRLKSRSREERDEHHNNMDDITKQIHPIDEGCRTAREDSVEIVASNDRVDESREVVFKPIASEPYWDCNQREA